MGKTCFYLDAQEHLRRVQAAWGRFAWDQVGASLQRYNDRLRAVVCAAYDEPAATARKLAGRVHMLEKGAEWADLARAGILKIQPKRASFLLREAVCGGEDGEVLQTAMFLLDQSRPRTVPQPRDPGNVGAALLRRWHKSATTAMVAYQKDRGDIFPLTEPDWYMRQKVALHRAELVVDVLEGHTAGYLNTQQKVATASRLICCGIALGGIGPVSASEIREAQIYRL